MTPDEIDGPLNALNEVVTTIDAAASELWSTFVAVDEMVEHLTAERDAAHETARVAIATLAERDAEVAVLLENNANQGETIAALHVERDALTAERNTLSQSVETWQRAHAAVSTERDALSEIISEQRTTITGLTVEIDAARLHLTEREADLQAERGRHEITMTERNDALRERDHAQWIASERLEQIHHLSGDLATRNNELAERTAERDEAQRIASLRLERIEQLSRNLFERTTELDLARAEVLRLTGEIGEMRPTVDELIAMLAGELDATGITYGGVPDLFEVDLIVDGDDIHAEGPTLRDALMEAEFAARNPDPDPDPDPDPVPMGPPIEAISVRIDARPDVAALDRIVDIFGTRTRYGLIIGSYDPLWKDPQGNTKAGPMASLDWWANPRSDNYILHHLAEIAGADRAVIEFTFPMLLRGAHTPAKDSASATRRRRALEQLANGTLRTLNGRLYLDDVAHYADAVAEGCDREGVDATCRGPHETDGFTVYPPSPAGWVVLDRDGGAVLTEHGIVTDQGVPVTTEMQCQYHRDSAMDEFAAAFRRFAGIFADRGIPMTRSGDKRNCDVIVGGPYNGRVVSDVHFDLIGDLFVPRAHGPSWWGIDLYAESALSVAGVIARYGGIVEQAARQARALGLPMSFGEFGEGSGREDVADDPLDRGEAWHGLFALLRQYPSSEFGHVCVYVPNNEHSIAQTQRPNRRAAVFSLLGAADRIGDALYDHEVRP